MAARQSLGRGLSALLGDSETAKNEENEKNEKTAINEVDIDLVEPNPEQPRTRFTDTALDELAQSISANGIVQPVVVRRKGAGYQIVAGERRWRAAQRAGLRRIPVTVREIADDKLLEIALIENIQRQELNPIEEARAYRKLIDSIGLTQEQVSERVGKERTLIATSLRLLKLPSDILQLIEEGKISAGHGRALLLIEDAAIQRRIARTIIEKGMSVREAERTIKNSRGSTTVNTDKKGVMAAKDPNVRHAETKLMRALGTNVRISPKGGGKAGKIEIEYYSSDDLDRLFHRLLNSKEG
jgi:ParB family transcriptional regulator, chromosome partitioning protein